MTDVEMHGRAVGEVRETAAGFGRCLLFELERELFALDVDCTREIIRFSKLDRAPGAADFVCGLINLRGEIVTVVDVALMLGVRQVQHIPQDGRIIIVDGPDVPVGLAVDRVIDISDYQYESVEQTVVGDEAERAKFIEGVWRSDRRGLVIKLRGRAFGSDGFVRS